MLDLSLKGTDLTPFSARVDCDRLRFFAQVTGEDNPVFRDEAVARAHGYPSLPLPPTFLFCLEMAGPRPMEVYERLQVPYAQVLHGEQHFVYHRLAFAGETLHFKPRIADLYEKKGGALGFIVWETRVEASDGAPVADLRSVMIVRPPQPASKHSAPRATVPAPAAQDGLPRVVAGPITRHQLGLYAGASGDYNPLHIDMDYARQAGMPDVFAHGMLSAAYLARVLTRWAEPAALRRLSVRFETITHIGDEVHCQARVAGHCIEHGDPCLTLAMAACNQAGETRLTGTAVVASAGLGTP